ncbi:MAG TPA: LPS export ABC transporter periplasmic protein LptC [Candidatus Coprenecus pullistercoris]|nr:LPS export ABC transporter periplasmic protein LptC [Candidatus Coprenecus pullistercoris]
MVAVLWTAAIVVSCSNKLKNIDADKIAEAPTQVVLNMDASQTENGMVQMRLAADRMERYETGEKESKEIFPEGFRVLAYNEEGLLETRIVSDQALHTVSGDNEQWSAYGNVVINNFIKGEKIETDTLYWDREKQRIYTDCYVRLSSPQGFMQGYGLESDERARNAQLLRPFDSYGIVSDDSTGSRYVDTVNFIGPNYKR